MSKIAIKFEIKDFRIVDAKSLTKTMKQNCLIILFQISLFL